MNYFSFLRIYYLTSSVVSNYTTSYLKTAIGLFGSFYSTLAILCCFASSLAMMSSFDSGLDLVTILIR